ncbi:hypothetical protein ACFYUV_45685 [Nonomuraea sp. NPDC003560]|uniref:hypothetical protein n=1 Tax=Nonomuraea sp. NPDC003560 TaxID=3364341 RepID=UPI00369AD275
MADTSNYAQVQRSRRPKRSRRTALTAAVASGVAVAAIVTVTTHVLSKPETSSTGSGTASVSSARASAPEPIEKLWPAAVHEVPAKLPDGRKVRPRLMMDTTKILLTAEAGFEKANGLYTYDVHSGEVAELADITLPAGTTLFPDGFTAGQGRVAWWTAHGAADKRTADIWTVPTTGGKPQLVTSAPLPPASSAGFVTGIAITPDRLAWSAGNEGVFTVDVNGGQPQRVDGAQGQHILSWPWVGSPGTFGGNEAPFQSVMNIETGEKRARTALQPGSPVACGITLCVTHPGRSAAAQVQDRDGRARQEMDVTGVAPQPLQQDRFLSAQLPDRAIVHDVRSGVSAEIRGIDTRTRYRAPAGSNIALFSRGDKFLVVDLTAIH